MYCIHKYLEIFSYWILRLAVLTKNIEKQNLAWILDLIECTWKHFCVNDCMYFWGYACLIGIPNFSYILKDKIWLNFIESWFIVKRYGKLLSSRKVWTWRKDVLLCKNILPWYIRLLRWGNSNCDTCVFMI